MREEFLPVTGVLLAFLLAFSTTPVFSCEIRRFTPDCRGLRDTTFRVKDETSTSRNVTAFGATSFFNDTASEMAYWILPAFLVSCLFIIIVSLLTKEPE